MKTLTSLLISGISILIFTACEKVTGEGPSVTQNRPIEGFTSVASSISADVVYTQEPQYKVDITAQQNILDVIETYKVNNELVIKVKDNVRLRHHDAIIIKISSPLTHALKISGSGNILSDSISTTDLNLSLSGSGNINVNKITATALEAGISGSGNITILNGVSATEKLRISGSGNMDLGNVEASSVNTGTSGSGEMRVNARESLDVTISGSGSVYYRGNPLINTHISGSGKVVHQ